MVDLSRFNAITELIPPSQQPQIPVQTARQERVMADPDQLLPEGPPTRTDFDAEISVGKTALSTLDLKELIRNLNVETSSVVSEPTPREEQPSRPRQPLPYEAEGHTAFDQRSDPARMDWKLDPSVPPDRQYSNDPWVAPPANDRVIR